MQWINRKLIAMQNCALIVFMWTFLYYLLYFADNFQKTYNFAWNCHYFKICRRNTIDSTKKFTEKSSGGNIALHFTSYFSIVLSKILPHLKTINYPKKLSVNDENNSCCVFNFLQTHILWNFDHISRTYNEINYKNIWSEKVITILSWR